MFAAALVKPIAASRATRATRAFASRRSMRLSQSTACVGLGYRALAVLDQTSLSGFGSVLTPTTTIFYERCEPSRRTTASSRRPSAAADTARYTAGRERCRKQGELTMAPVTVRYIVDDVDAAIAFYTQRLGFGVALRPAPGFAIVSRGDLRLLLNAPIGPGGAAQPMPDGRKPEPGGWNRIQLQVADLASEVETLRKAGVHFRNDIVAGMGGKQILLDDPAGNPIELFEPPRQ